MSLLETINAQARPLLAAGVNYFTAARDADSPMSTVAIEASLVLAINPYDEREARLDRNFHPREARRGSSIAGEIGSTSSARIVIDSTIPRGEPKLFGAGQREVYATAPGRRA